MGGLSSCTSYSQGIVFNYSASFGHNVGVLLLNSWLNLYYGHLKSRKLNFRRLVNLPKLHAKFECAS